MTRLHGATFAFLLPFALLACGPDAPADRSDDGLVPSAQATVVRDSSGVARAPRRVSLYGIDLTGVGYDKGDPDAPVVVVDFSDFGCPFCGSHARQTLPALEREFIATGKVFYKYVPFVMGMFPHGDAAARAAECAAEQGRFWPMHDALYAVQREWKQARDPAPLFRSRAAALGLDAKAYDACLADGHTDARTRVATDRANRLGIRATPTFFIGEQAAEGALPLDVFQKLLRERTAR